MIRAEADQKRKAGDQRDRVEGRIESLLHDRKREQHAHTAVAERQERNEKYNVAGMAAFVRSLDPSAVELTGQERQFAQGWSKGHSFEALKMRIAAIQAEPQQPDRGRGPDRTSGPSR